MIKKIKKKNWYDPLDELPKEASTCIIKKMNGQRVVAIYALFYFYELDENILLSPDEVSSWRYELEKNR